MCLCDVRRATCDVLRATCLCEVRRATPVRVTRSTALASDLHFDHSKLIREAIARGCLIFFERDPEEAAGYIREAGGKRFVEPLAGTS
jgi:hypothetical protein